MNRTSKFIYNVISTSIQQIILMIVGFIVPKIMLNTYGSEINGLVSSITQFIQYFNLVEAGLAGAAVYSLYKPLADKNYKKINSIICAAKRFYTLSGYIFLSLVLGFACIYPVFIKVSTLSPISIGILVIILGMNGVLEFFTLAKYRVLLTADQKTYVISIATSISTIVNTIIIVILTRINVDIVVVRGVAVLSIFLRTILLQSYVKRKYKYINYNEVCDYSALDKRWDSFYLQILGTVNIGAPMVVATIFLSLKKVSIYSVYNIVLNGVNGVLSIFISGLAASFGDVIVKGEKELLKKTYNEFEFLYCSIITIVYSILMSVIMPFISIYTRNITDINYNIPLLGSLFVINGFLYNLKTPQGMLVISAGLYKETKKQTTIQGLIAVIFEPLLAIKFGLEGIVVGSIMSNLYRCIDLLFFIPKNVTKLDVKITALRWIRSIVQAGIIIFTVKLFNTSCNGYAEWVLYSTIIGLYSIVIVLISSFIFERNNLKSIISRILNIINKSKILCSIRGKYE